MLTGFELDDQQGGQTLPPIPSTSSADNSSIQPTPPSIDSTTNNLQVISGTGDDLYIFSGKCPNVDVIIIVKKSKGIMKK